LLSRSRSAKKRGQYEAELWAPDFPIPLAYLWLAYHRIRRRKGGNGFGAVPIEWSDIDAFNRLSGMALVPWEVAMLERLDDAFMKAMAEAQKTDEK
jgi:hypothetical protein